MNRDFFLGALTSSVIFSIIFIIFSANSTLRQDPENSRASISAVEVKAKKVILLWTPLKGTADGWQEHFRHWDENPFTACQTPAERMCYVTTDKTMLDTSAVVIFNVNDLLLGSFSDQASWAEAVLPPIRQPQQLWALFWRESPGKLDLPEEKLAWLDGFNWTISYRQDADVFYPFGYVDDMETGDEDAAAEIDWKEINGRRSAVWYSDDCKSISKMEDYAVALEQLSNNTFKMHAYGKCVGKIPKLKKGSSVMKALRKKIRFYLAFESEICDDYITDVYFSALKYKYVPIVFGGQDLGYDEIGLAGTYIDALAFDGPEKLFEHLIELSIGDLDELIQYHQWQNEYSVHPPDKWTCQLCRKINELPEANVINNFTHFWHRKKCYGSYSKYKGMT